MVIISKGILYGQSSYFIYPPLCDEMDQDLIKFDTSYVRFDCNLLCDSIGVLYVKNDLLDLVSVMGWVIIRSQWNDSLAFNSNYSICLENDDKGWETFIDYHEFGKIKGVYQRSRTIAIFNLYECKSYYLANRNFFQLFNAEGKN